MTDNSTNEPTDISTEEFHEKQKQQPMIDAKILEELEELQKNTKAKPLHKTVDETKSSDELAKSVINDIQKTITIPKYEFNSDIENSNKNFQANMKYEPKHRTVSSEDLFPGVSTKRYNETIESLHEIPTKYYQCNLSANSALFKTIAEQQEHDELLHRLDKLEDKAYNIGFKDVMMFMWNIVVGLMLFELINKSK